MSNVFELLGKILKVIFPILRTAAEKAFKKLPKEQQDKLIQVSKLVEVIKQTKGLTLFECYKAIEQHTGLTTEQAAEYLIQYLKDKGKESNGLSDAIITIWADAEQRTETGVKSLWIGISNIVSATVANIDWSALLMGLGEFVYQQFVKGKIKI